MTPRDNESLHASPLRAAAPVASGLLAGAALFVGAAWWLSQPRTEVAELGPAEQAEAAAPEPPTTASLASESEERAELAPEPDAEPAAPPPVRLAVDDDAPGADHLEASRLALAEGEIGEAVLALRRHLHHAPPTFDVLLRLGRLTRETGDLALSRAALERAVALAPEDVEGRIQLARTHLEAGRAKDAAAAAEAAVRLGPSEPLAWDLLGRAEMARSEWQAADIALGRAMDLDPANPHLHNHRGLLYVFMRKGARAVDALETAVELFGDDVPHYVLNNLGLAFELEGRLEAARGAFEEALGASPFYVKARVNLRRVDRKLAARFEAEAKTVADGAGAAALAAEVPAEASEDASEDVSEDVSVDEDVLDEAFEALDAVE